MNRFCGGILAVVLVVASVSSVHATAKLHIKNTSNENYWHVVASPDDGGQEYGTESWYNLAPGAVHTGTTMYSIGEREIYFIVNTTGKTHHSQRINRGEPEYRSWSKKTIFVTAEQLSNNETITLDIPDMTERQEAIQEIQNTVQEREYGQEAPAVAHRRESERASTNYRAMLAEEKKKEPCPFDLINRAGDVTAAAGLVYTFWALVDDNGDQVYEGLTWTGIGLGVAILGYLANMPCKRRYKEARNASITSFGDVGCMVVDHVQITASPDGKQGQAGLKFDF